MSGWQTAALGAVAGGTIFLGLPLGRVGGLDPRVRAFLSTVSAGILLFIFWDVVSAAASVIIDATIAFRHGGSGGRLAADMAMLTGGFTAGAVGLAAIERRMRRLRPLAPMAGGSVDAALAGVDVSDVAEQARRAALAMGMLIAVAIGVHNFSEGLAIGVAARTNEIAFAGTLIIGFALHNATEGIGIIGPLGDARPSWRWLGAAGLVGGGPTFLGALLGYRISAVPLQLAFLALAAGAILFVVGELWTAAGRRASRNVVLAGIVCGFLAGFVTDLVLVFAGA
jgi:ZIP family zinc transporter